MENVSVQMEWALPFSWVFSFPCSKSRAIHQRCGLYRLWVLFPGKVVSQLLASAHEVEQTMGYYYRMARALYHHCCLRNMAPFLAVKRLQFCCDNSSAVFSINPGNSKTPHIVDFVRHVMLLSIQHNFTVRAHHVTGVSNEIADALSRFQMQCFRPLPPTPTKILVPTRLHSRPSEGGSPAVHYLESGWEHKSGLQHWGKTVFTILPYEQSLKPKQGCVTFLSRVTDIFFFWPR